MGPIGDYNHTYCDPPRSASGADKMHRAQDRGSPTRSTPSASSARARRSEDNRTKPKHVDYTMGTTALRQAYRIDVWLGDCFVCEDPAGESSAKTGRGP